MRGRGLRLHLPLGLVPARVKKMTPGSWLWCVGQTVTVTSMVFHGPLGWALMGIGIGILVTGIFVK